MRYVMIGVAVVVVVTVAVMGVVLEQRRDAVPSGPHPTGPSQVLIIDYYKYSDTTVIADLLFQICSRPCKSVSAGQRWTLQTPVN